jgi:hypothetical protein
MELLPICLKQALICLEKCLIRRDFGCRLVLSGLVKLLISMFIGAASVQLPRWTSRVRTPSPAF